MVLCVDEKAQALERAAPVLPLRPGIPRSAAMSTSGTALPRSGPPPARSPASAAPGTGTRSSCSSSARSPGPVRGCRCPSGATTTARTPTPACGPGWPAAPGSPCISRPRRVVAEHGRGLLDHRTAGHPPRQLHLGQGVPPPRHRRFSPTGGTTAATPSPGPRPPTIYSPNGVQVKEPRSHDTRTSRHHACPPVIGVPSTVTIKVYLKIAATVRASEICRQGAYG
jgi:hypothetical protein